MSRCIIPLTSEPSSFVHQMRESLHERRSQGALMGCDIQTRQVVVPEASDGQDSASGAASAPAYLASVRLTGPDQPGLLMQLTEMLASHGLNVEHIQTEQHVAPADPRKPRLFSCSGLVSGAEEPDAKAMAASISRMRRELKVTCEIVREDAGGRGK